VICCRPVCGMEVFHVVVHVCSAAAYPNNNRRQHSFLHKCLCTCLGPPHHNIPGPTPVSTSNRTMECTLVLQAPSCMLKQLF
jgi:ribosomal protein L37E